MSDKNALVIDDNAANRDFLERLMSMAGYTVCSGATGKAGLELTEAHPDFKIALVDMELPDINGIQLTAILRERFPTLYIVVATMHDDRSLMESVFVKGGNTFLVKPHGFMELYKRLTTVDLAVLRDEPCTVIDQYGPRAYQLAARS